MRGIENEREYYGDGNHIRWGWILADLIICFCGRGWVFIITFGSNNQHFLGPRCLLVTYHDFEYFISSGCLLVTYHGFECFISSGCLLVTYHGFECFISSGCLLVTYNNFNRITASSNLHSSSFNHGIHDLNRIHHHRIHRNILCANRHQLPRQTRLRDN